MTPATIIHVDDDGDERQLVERALEESGFPCRFLGLESGVALFEHLAHPERLGGASVLGPTLILLDLNMPPMDGKDVLRRLKASPESSGIPVIVLTSNDSPGIARECYRLGCASYIRKPDTFSRLVETMKSIGSYWTNTVELPSHD